MYGTACIIHTRTYVPTMKCVHCIILYNTHTTCMYSINYTVLYALYVQYTQSRYVHGTI